MPKKKVKGWKPQFSETVREQAAERALRKRMIAKGKSHKQIVARRKALGFLSDAEQTFNSSFRKRSLAKGLSKQETRKTLRGIKTNQGRRIARGQTGNTPPGQLPTRVPPRRWPSDGHNHPMPERNPSGEKPMPMPRIPSRMPERNPTGEKPMPKPMPKPRIPSRMPERDPRGTMPKVPYPKGQNPWKTKKQRKV